MALLHPNIISAVALAAGTIAVYLVSQVVYNLYFHPLARFPGPLAHRATRLAFLRRYIKGTLSKDLLAFHDKYGPIVRIAPDELAFNHPDAWKDIYGHKAEEFPKFLTFYPGRGGPPNIVTTQHHFDHRKLRHQLAPQFSDRSMREQEPIFTQYMDLMIKRMHEKAEGPGPKPVFDMVSWYTWTAFDIIGDLAFGEPFGCLDRAGDDPWINAVFDAINKTPYLTTAAFLGVDKILMPLLKAVFSKGRAAHDARTKEKLEKRMKLEVERPDLMEGFLKQSDSLNLDFQSLRSNAGAIIMAGSETTSTLLSGATYLLLRNPEVLQKLTEEVRCSFDSEEDITLLSVSKLGYMLACLNEAMRCYPPVPVGFPRIIPKGRGSVKIANEVVPDDTVVAVWQWAAYHSADNFTDPFGYHPERFLNDPRFANDKLDMLQPFSVGPRNCVGRNLAYAEMRLIMARIIYNFDMQLVDESVDWLDHKSNILHIKPSLPVYLTPVKR